MKPSNHIRNKDTFSFFKWKWKRVPNKRSETSKIYRKWYIKKYNYTRNSFKKFLSNQNFILDAGCGMNFLKQVKDLKVKNAYEDDACVAVVAKKF